MQRSGHSTQTRSVSRNVAIFQPPGKTYDPFYKPLMPIGNMLRFVVYVCNSAGIHPRLHSPLTSRVSPATKGKYLQTFYWRRAVGLLLSCDDWWTRTHVFLQACCYPKPYGSKTYWHSHPCLHSHPKSCITHTLVHFVDKTPPSFSLTSLRLMLACVRDKSYISSPSLLCKALEPESLACLLVGKIQFNLSDIATPDSLIGHHKILQSPTRFGGEAYQDLFRQVYQLIIYVQILISTYRLLRLHQCWHWRLSVACKVLYGVVRFGRKAYTPVSGQYNVRSAVICVGS